MISHIVALSLLVGSTFCVPVLSPHQGTGIRVYVQKDPNNPNDLQPVTTLSPMEKRQEVTVIESWCSDANDPNSCAPTTTYVENAATPTPTPSPQPETQPEQGTTTPTDTTAPTNTGSDDGSPLSDGISLLTTINKWRQAYGKNTLTWSDDLVGVAANTGQLDQGSSSLEAHHSSPPANAEVITPGSDNDLGKDLQGRSPFEISYISWLCEVRYNGDPLGGECDFQQTVMWM